MNSELEAAERAEFIQSVKALLIPSSLFVACVMMAAGFFLICNHEPLGWIFAAISLTTVVAALTGFIRFQNKYRARGILKDGTDAEVIVDDCSQTATIPDAVVEDPDILDFSPPVDTDVSLSSTTGI